jgi:hypothetical protein
MLREIDNHGPAAPRFLRDFHRAGVGGVFGAVAGLTKAYQSENLEPLNISPITSADMCVRAVHKRRTLREQRRCVQGRFVLNTPRVKIQKRGASPVNVRGTALLISRDNLSLNLISG